MNRQRSAVTVAPHRRRRLSAELKRALRELRMQLSLLNLSVGALLDLKDIDLDCLDLIASHGPLNPSTLARRARLHPATITGILDRLERGGWVARERDPADRRAVVVRALHQRTAELIHLYSGMNASMDEICAGYAESELELVTDFLQRTAQAGQAEMDKLAEAARSREA